MSGIHHKIKRHTKRIKRHSVKRKNKEHNSYVVGMLELLNQKCKTTMINVLKTLMEIVNNMQE